MKHLIAAIVIVLVSSLGALAQTAPDAAELTKMLNEFLAGASKNDPAAHDRFWADDLIYTRSSGVRTNKQEIMKGLRDPPAPKSSDPGSIYSADDIIVHQYGDTAIVAFRLVIESAAAGPKKVANNLNTGVFLKRDGVWQVVAWQSTIVPDLKPEMKPKGAVATVKKSASKEETAHSYQKGSRGGCYYLNAGSGKVYVDHKYCQQ